MIPVQKTVNGTGASVPFIPDIFQNPFQIGIGVLATGSVTSTAWAIEHCFDYSTVMSPTWNGTGGVTWFANSGLGGTTAGGTTTLQLNGNYAFAVAAIRVNVYTAVSTSVVIANFLQSVNSP